MNEKYGISNFKNRELVNLLLGRKGGRTTIRIIDQLLIQPYNINQLSKILKLDYKTVKYHIILTLKSDLIEGDIEKYGSLYFPTQKLINNLKEYQQIKKYLYTIWKWLIMKSETAKEHQNQSSKDISCGIITLSDSRKSKKADLSGQYMADEIETRYTLKSRKLIPDEKDDLIDAIEQMVSENIDVILTTGGTGLDTRDITVETVEELFEKKLDGFGEIFRAKSFEEIGSAALLSRATAGIYKKTVIFSMPGSPNAVKTAFSIIIDELPHFVHHVKKWKIKMMKFIFHHILF